jgi:NTE family protein
MGAYETGVLRYVSQILAKEKIKPPWFSIFTGTSVGALNASFLAGYAQDFPAAVESLVSFWESITFNKILSFDATDLGAMMKLSSGQNPESTQINGTPDQSRGAPHPPVAGLFDTSPLFEEIKNRVPWNQLKANIAEDIVRGIAFCATEVCTGTSVIFYETSPSTFYRCGQDPSKEARPVSINVEHAMASAAVPILFPSIQIDGTCYIDGSLRQNTPLNPALRMGADRVLVINVGQDPKAAAVLARKGCRQNRYPGIPFMLGKTISAFLTESLDYELNRIEMYNRLISRGTEIYGEGFLDNLNLIMGSLRNTTYRPIDTLHIRPSQNLDLLAREVFEEAPDELAPSGLSGRIIRKMLSSSAFVESTLFSFLMFTPRYIRLLLDIGYQDAQVARDTIVEYYSS